MSFASARRVIPWSLAALLVAAACGGSDGGPKGPQKVVLAADSADFLVCQDTLGQIGINPVGAVSMVGNLELMDPTSFLAGECRTVLMFNSSALSVITDPTKIDSIRLQLTITGNEPGSVPPGDIVVETINWTGSMDVAFDDIDMSNVPATFTPSAKGFLLDAMNIPGVVGTDGLMAFRLRMLSPAALNGATHAWDIGMADGPPASAAKLTYYWTP